jgi:hypothetical protein
MKQVYIVMTSGRTVTRNKGFDKMFGTFAF